MEFLVLGGIGLGVLLFSLIFGEIFGVDSPLDADIFSIATISAFLGAFGFGAAGAEALTKTLWVAIPVGIVMGLLFASFSVWLSRKLKAASSHASHSTKKLIGYEGRVLTAIPADGYGQVTIIAAGQRRTYSAKAPIGIDAGTRVWVTDILSATAVSVSPTDSLSPHSVHELPDAPGSQT